MGRHDDQRPHRGQDRINPRRAKADAEHDPDKVKQKCTADADDDRRHDAVCLL